MEPLIALAALILVSLIGSVFMKNYLEKKRIARARMLVDLHDDLHRMQNAMAILPELYLDMPTKLFMIKRIMQLIEKVQEVGSESNSLTMLHEDLATQLEKTLNNQDDSIKRLSKWGKLSNPDTAQEIRMLTKYLHSQVLVATKTHLVPRAHAARVVKNLKVIMYRVPLDLNFNLANVAIKSNKLRPALGKLRVALGLLLKSPIRQHLKKQHEQIEMLIKQTEEKIAIQQKAKSANTTNKLASGVEELDKEDDWNTKKNLYDSN